MSCPPFQRSYYPQHQCVSVCVSVCTHTCICVFHAAGLSQLLSSHSSPPALLGRTHTHTQTHRHLYNPKQLEKLSLLFGYFFYVRLFGGSHSPSPHLLWLYHQIQPLGCSFYGIIKHFVPIYRKNLCLYPHRNTFYCTIPTFVFLSMTQEI